MHVAQNLALILSLKGFRDCDSALSHKGTGVSLANGEWIPPLMCPRQEVVWGPTGTGSGIGEVWSLSITSPWAERLQVLMGDV